MKRKPRDNAAASSVISSLLRTPGNNVTLAGMRPAWGLLALLVALPASAATGCGDDRGAPAGSSGKIRAVTTVAPITSIVESIGGTRVSIAGIVPEGANSHTFEPRPSDAERLARADVLYVNGLGLEEPTTKLAEQTMRDGADVVELGAQAIPAREHIYDASFPRSGGRPNPHLWTNPRYAVAYAQVIRDDLARRDPDGTPYYNANLRSFRAEVGELDRAMRAAFATVPRARRKLLTYHDAFAYVGRDYGWEVVGAIQPSDVADPTPKDVARLVKQVRAERVPAIFGSEAFPSAVLEQIGREAGVKYVDVLRDDDLPGAPGDPQHSWAGLMIFDYVTMTEAMGGDATALKALEPSAATAPAAEYPQ